MAIVAKKVQDAKSASIKELKTAFENTADFIFTEYRGLTVEQITGLRKNLRAKEAGYKVVKNNFARLAFEELKAPDVSKYLVGPTALALATKDSNEVAKILMEAAREYPVLKIKGAIVGNAVYDAAQVEAFSKLPGRLELVSMLMSVMQGPARNLAGCLNDVNARLVRTVKAIADKKAAAQT
ncbi:MAG: 50S ribosomal protein L10 [Spirochaetaceae bacterium]|jgi:large subunit ribosomal protein L10|nr:50S ribosomal protein L10 [Spirochaetaceae bacterium]GMO20148.1 MAG: 50S ribosomal protein L10 [Termitinemataceae bacterium]